MEGTPSRGATQKHLDLGSGPNPSKYEGWFHLDTRNLPGIDYVQDCRDLSIFSDDTWDRITARDVIEHIPYRDVPDAVKEWVRVLHYNGEIWIQSPLAEYAFSLIYADGPTRLIGEDNWLHFNRVVFGHQDYPENFHASLWTLKWVKELLRNAGVREIKEVAADAPGSFRVWARK